MDEHKSGDRRGVESVSSIIKTCIGHVRGEREGIAGRPPWYCAPFTSFTRAAPHNVCTNEVQFPKTYVEQNKGMLSLHLCIHVES